MENKNLKILNYSFLFIIIFFPKINIIYSEENIENESLEWLTSYLKINTVNPPGIESRAVNSTVSPTIYDANLTFYEQGSWVMSVEISTIPGKEYEVEFPMEVSGDSIVNNGSAGYFFVFVFLVLTVGVLVLTLKYRKKNREGT